MEIVEIIVKADKIVDELEQIKGYWDEKGLDMHIAVKKNRMLAVSTKHWARVHYIKTDLNTDDIWKKVKIVAFQIGRMLIESEKGPYVYVPKLNIKQTQIVFNYLKGALGGKIIRKFQRSWRISDAVLPY